MKNYLFTILICFSILAALPVVWNKLIFSKVPFSSHTEEILYKISSESSDEPEPETSFTATETDISNNIENISEQTSETAAGETQPADISEEKTFTAVDNSYWSDALFIGDSRTMGLSEYADLGNAHVFASSGMSVYKVFSEQLSVSGSPKQTLETLLTQNRYGKIYIMLGINELGYDFDQTVRKYKEMLDTVQQYQPDAIFFLQANLHVTEKQSSSDPLFNNPAINRINEQIAALADNKTLFYIDVNELFDDEQGNLSTEFAGDAAHIYGKYYAQWAEWLLTKGIE